LNAGRSVRAIVAIALGIGFAGAAIALDANTATQAELETIRGVGPALSARIVEARRARPFTDLDDLKARVRGIGDSNLRRMREAGLAVGPSARVQTFTGQPAAARAKREAGRRSGPPDAARR
jgi:competence protein ComEA